jgi:hypothetical protein
LGVLKEKEQNAKSLGLDRNSFGSPQNEKLSLTDLKLREPENNPLTFRHDFITHLQKMITGPS